MKKSAKTREENLNTHFVSTFLEAQQVTTLRDKDSILTRSAPLLKNKPRFHGSVPSKLFSASSSDFFCSDIRRGSKDSDRSEPTRTLFIKNIAEDSQPSDSQPSDSESSLYDNMLPDQDKASTLGKPVRLPSQKRHSRKGKVKDIRRTRSELEVNKTTHKKTPFSSFTRAFSPFIFRSRKQEKGEESQVRRTDSMSSIPVVLMETGFPATSSTNLAPDMDTASTCVRGLVSPLVHPRNSLNLATVPRGSLHLEDQIENTPTRDTMSLSHNIIQSTVPPGRPTETRLSRARAGGSSPNFRRIQPQKYLSLDTTTVHNRTMLSTPTNILSTPTNIPSTPTNIPSTPTNKPSTPTNIPSTPTNVNKSTPIILRKPLDKSTNKQHEPGPKNNLHPTVNFTGEMNHVTDRIIRPAATKPLRVPSDKPGPVFSDKPGPRKCAECQNVLLARHSAADGTVLARHSAVSANMSSDSGVSQNTLREEMQDLLKRYSPPKAGSYDNSSLHHKLREIKTELEEYKSFVQTNRKIGELREELERPGDTRPRRQHSDQDYNDEVFYKTDKEMLDYSSVTIPTEQDYYKEIEVRINHEGIAVVRRRHRVLPASGTRSEYNQRRSTIHVDDRVFCDKAVLQSIYGHTPTHYHNEQRPRDSDEDVNSRSLKKGVHLRPFLHQKSVPNLHTDYAYQHERYNSCPETEKLEKEVQKSNTSNLPVPKKYIRAYTKFYEKRLALKLIDLNRFIQEEKAMKGVLIEKIRKSFHENDELLKSLNSTKKDILSMIEDIETPV